MTETAPTGTDSTGTTGQPVYDRHGVTVHNADCLAVLRTLPDASVDSVVSDPPYGLGDHTPAQIVTALTAWANGDREHVPDGRGFLGEHWDSFVPGPAVWDECLRVLKPGGHLLCFAGARTVDLMGLAVRLAGFDVRDVIMWVNGNGFPKGLNVSKAIDRAAGADREVTGLRRTGIGTGRGGTPVITEGDPYLTAPATDDARRWDGWSTTLRPAHEPIIVARKPLDGSVAANVVHHGTGAINVDACRIEATDGGARVQTTRSESGTGSVFHHSLNPAGPVDYVTPAGGRWPTNVLYGHADRCETDGCDPEWCPVAELDRQTGHTDSQRSVRRRAGSMPGNGITMNHWISREDNVAGHNDAGGGSRFFPTFRYEAKAGTAERPMVNGVTHRTQKPLALMRWLVRLVTQPGGLVLDPFAGTGTTGHAARAEGMRALLIEREADYLPLIRARLDARARTPAATTGEVSGDEPMDLLDLLDQPNTAEDPQP